MAPIPTIQTQNSAEKRTTRPLGGSSSTERKSELVTRVKYCNTLPDLPFDTKFISYPFGSNRFVTYSTTSLERNYLYEVLTEPDLGVDVELVIPNAYNLAPNTPVPQLDAQDERLLEDDAAPQKDHKRSRHHAKSVSWLRRTEYISTEQTRFQPQTIDKVEAKVGYSIKKSLLKDDLGHYMDRESQVKSIEKTFEDSLIPVESHFAKPGVTPVEILPVFPDFKLWKYPCAQVIFDSDPAPIGRSVPAQLEEMSQAMIRGVMDESGEQFVAYFLPTEETLGKRKEDVDKEREYEDDEVYEYRMAREYNWNVKSKATKGYEENYFFAIREDGVYYNELETRVRLNKRRVRGPNQQLNTKLCVKHIPLAASDYKFQRKREKELEPLAEEEEEEEEEEDDKSDDGAGENKEKSAEKSDDERESPRGNKSVHSDDSDGDRANKSDQSDNENENERRKSEKSDDSKSSSSESDNKSDDESSKKQQRSRRAIKSDDEDDSHDEEDVKSKKSKASSSPESNVNKDYSSDGSDETLVSKVSRVSSKRIVEDNKHDDSSGSDSGSSSGKSNSGKSSAKSSDDEDDK